LQGEATVFRGLKSFWYRYLCANVLLFLVGIRGRFHPVSVAPRPDSRARHYLKIPLTAESKPRPMYEVNYRRGGFRNRVWPEADAKVTIISITTVRTSAILGQVAVG
jgi:hypothetical protein